MLFLFAFLFSVVQVHAAEVRANEAVIWYETFGNEADKPLLLIMGAGSQGLMWPEQF